jgi:alpha-N-arabinofuranosidase
MRDALAAAASLHIFNSRADVVHMANIAQLVNVLQSVILTDGAKMVKTPTYHVFKMLGDHQDATLLESHQVCDTSGIGEWTVPQLSHSATVSADGAVTLTVCNLSASQKAEVSLSVLGRHMSARNAEVLSGGIRDKNTFERPDAVTPADFSACRLDEHNRTGTQMTLDLPACCVVRLTLG